jgi:hypothetical protein
MKLYKSYTGDGWREGLSGTDCQEKGFNTWQVAFGLGESFSKMICK